MDVKTAFLNGNLEQEIYMPQPEGYAVLGHEIKYVSLKNRFTVLNKLTNSDTKNLIARYYKMALL